MRSEGTATVTYDELLTEEQIDDARKSWARQQGWHVTAVDRTTEYLDVGRGERIKGPETTTFYLDGEPQIGFETPRSA